MSDGPARGMTGSAEDGRMPLVSVISVFYNRTERLEESVRSLLDQTYAHLEIILVDDGSTDGTGEMLDRFAGENIVVIRHTNRGFTTSLVEAIGASRGEFIAIHGAGDLSAPSRIEKQVRRMLWPDEPGIVASCCLTDKPFQPEPMLHRPRLSGDLRKDLLVRNVFLHGEVMFRRTAYERAGGYRPFFRFGQDYDLWLRMSEFTQAAFVDEVLYTRHIATGSLTADPVRTAAQTRLAVFARHCARERQRCGSDPVDRGEGDAALKAFKSRDAALVFAHSGAMWMLTRDMDEGWSLLKASLSESVTLTGLLRSAVFSLHKVKPVWALIEPLVRRRILK